MKKLILICFVMVALFFSNKLVAQNKAVKTLQPINYASNVYNDLTSQEFGFLSEVFQDKLQESVLDRPNMLLAYKNLLRNRIVVKQFNQVPNSDKYKNLKDTPLFTVYNSNLTRDVLYNKNTFNVLKYNLPFFGGNGGMFRINNTNYFLIIKPQSYKK